MADQFQQTQQLGLDQIADVINRQKIGDRRLRNQMMQLGTTDPNAFAMQNKDFLQQAKQPQELMFAGSNNTPAAVQQDGYQLKGYDDAGLQSLYNTSPQYKGFDPSYTDSAGKKYFSLEQQDQIEKLGPNFIGGAKTSYDLNPTQAGGYYFSDPWGFSHSVDKVNPNQYFVSGDTLNTHTRSGTADTFYGLDTSKDLSGLLYGKYNNKEGLFFNPNKTNISSLLTPQRNNSAYAEKKGGSLGGFLEKVAKYTDPGFYNVMGGGTDKSFWKEMDQGGLYNAVFSKLDPILDKVDPLHNPTQDLIADTTGADSQREAFNQIAPSLVNYFVPMGLGYVINAANSANQGDTTGAVTNLASYGAGYLNSPTTGADGTSTGLYGSGTSLGSVAADQAAQNFITNAAINTAANGGDVGQAMKSAAFSTASGAAGDWLGKNLNGTLGEIGSRALGGAASGGLNSLFSKNNAVQGSLFGGMSGGLHGFLNSTSRSNNDFNQQTNKQNKQTANNITNLAKTIYKMRK